MEEMADKNLKKDFHKLGLNLNDFKSYFPKEYKNLKNKEIEFHKNLEEKRIKQEENLKKTFHFMMAIFILISVISLVISIASQK